MADYYTPGVSEDTITCSLKDYEKLKALWQDESNEGYPPDLLFENGKLWLSASECFNPDAIPDKALKYFGKILRKANLTHHTVGIAFTCSKMRVGGFGGYYIRFYPDGKTKTSTVVFIGDKDNQDGGLDDL